MTDHDINLIKNAKSIATYGEISDENFMLVWDMQHKAESLQAKNEIRSWARRIRIMLGE